MKKLLAIALVLCFASVVFASSQVPYATQENTLERVAEEIIRDSWGSLTNWSPPQQRIQRIRIIPQANDIDVALDVRLGIDDNLTAAMIRGGFIMDCRDSILLLLENPQLEEITEIRFFGSFEPSGSSAPVARLVISRNLASQIPWERISLDDAIELIRRGGGNVWLINALR